jgi:hypothetical protein
LALVFAAAVVLFWQLIPPPVPGVADNGDFAKLLGRYALNSGAYFEYANTKFFFADKYRYRSGFISSETLLIAPALAISRVIFRDGPFDLRIVGAVHASLFLLAVFLAAPALDGAGMGALALLLFCDFMYAGFFNSFYVEAAAYLFVALAAAFYLRAVRSRRGSDSIALLVSMLLTVGASPHYAILGPWFAALFWVARDVLCGGRKTIAAAASLSLILAAWVSIRFFAPVSYAPKAPFNVIFSQILPNSAHPDRALEELGLDGSYRRWIGTQAYTPGVPMDDPVFYQAFEARTSYRKIARYYLRHPAEAWQALRASLDEAGRFQSPLGNFDSGSGHSPAAHYESFQLASGFKRRLFFHRGGRLFLALAAIALLAPALCLWNRRRAPAGAVSGVCVLAAMAMTSLLVSSLGDVYDQFRHQVVSFELFDMLLLCLVWGVVKLRFGISHRTGHGHDVRLP